MSRGARRSSMGARPVRWRSGSGFRSIGLALAVAVTAAIALAGCATGGTRELTGDLMTHDPALAVEDGTSYVYSTGNAMIADGNIQIRSSADGRDWRYRGEVWEEKPEWLGQAVPGVSNLWAPELVEHDGTWYLYYSASTFGSNVSVIALATNEALDPDAPDYEWVDRGQVLASSNADDFNAIDPGIVLDEAGDPWMSFGSFWSGIRMIPLEWPSGAATDASAPLRLADRQSPPNAIEAPYIVRHDGDYFLFVSRDACCQGIDSTYNIAVGRSNAVDGPYVDREGVPLLEGGGTLLLAAEGDRIGPGGQSVQDGTLALHYYDRRLSGSFQLALVPVAWDDEGWPVAHW
jgi:arabinan endo-1,5-alpha-L-arabinosidase